MDATSLKEAVLSGVGGGSWLKDTCLKLLKGVTVFAHILIWHLHVFSRKNYIFFHMGETCAAEGKEVITTKTQEFLALLPIVRDHIIDGFSPEAREVFHREFDFFEKVTTISGALYPLPKEERRAGINSLPWQGLKAGTKN
ncbi:hypothetical protein Lser_V15G04728 [Lactuca serriola]